MVSTQEERLPVRVPVSVRGLNALDHSPTIWHHSPLYCMHFPFFHTFASHVGLSCFAQGQSPNIL